MQNRDALIKYSPESRSFSPEFTSTRASPTQLEHGTDLSFTSPILRFHDCFNIRVQLGLIANTRPGVGGSLQSVNPFTLRGRKQYC